MAILSSGLDWSGSIDEESASAIKLAFAIFSVLMGLSGLAVMTVRWLSLRTGKQAASQETGSPPEYSVLQARVTAMQMESTPLEPESTMGSSSK
jgi:hypothetical protein